MASREASIGAQARNHVQFIAAEAQQQYANAQAQSASQVQHIQLQAQAASHQAQNVQQQMSSEAHEAIRVANVRARRFEEEIAKLRKEQEIQV